MRQVTIQQLPESSFEMNESMNVLRTNVSYSGEKKKLILITSPEENEGKSTVAFQLCLNFAAAGQRVLLIDADLRKSVIVGEHGIRTIDKLPMLGLADLLSGKAEPNDVVYQADSAGICLTPIGHYVLNPTPLFESKTFQSFLDYLSKYFDEIIIDSPPINQVIDAAIIAPLCDGTIIVASEGKTTYEQLNEAKKQLQRVHAKIFGCVLNNVGQPDGHYYYKKYKKYSYGGKNEESVS